MNTKSSTQNPYGSTGGQAVLKGRGRWAYNKRSQNRGSVGAHLLCAAAQPAHHGLSPGLLAADTTQALGPHGLMSVAAETRDQRCMQSP